jgi:hypothetical protein
MKKQEYKKIKYEKRKCEDMRTRKLEKQKIKKFEDENWIVLLGVIKCMYCGVRACSRTDCL